MTPDYYAVLGVQATAEDEVIIAAYKALAKKYHPDTAGPASSAGRFVEIQEAYDVLRVPSRRAAYDRMRAAEAHDAQQKTRAQQHGREAEHQPPGGKGPGGEPGQPTAARRFLAPMLAAAIAILLAAAMAVVVHVGRTVPVAEGGQDGPAPQEAAPEVTDAGGKSVRVEGPRGNRSPGAPFEVLGTFAVETAGRYTIQITGTSEDAPRAAVMVATASGEELEALTATAVSLFKFGGGACFSICGFVALLGFGIPALIVRARAKRTPDPLEQI